MTKYKFISILALLIVLMPFGLKAQGVGIAFEQNISVSQLLEKAKAQGKMAFIDCYTTWCGPCRKMSKEIFPQKIVGDYFNKHFVSLKLDMEKGEGPNRQKEWDVNAYPTLIFLNSDGSLAFRTVGSMDADKLIAEVKTLMKSHGKSDAQRKWENGDHSTEVASAYIAELQKTRQEQAIDQVISIWALESREVILHDSTAFKLFITHVSDPHAEVFTYLYSHADELRAQQGQQAVIKLEEKWKQWCKSFYVFSPENNTTTIDMPKLNAYVEYMKRHGVALADQYAMSYILPISFVNKDKTSLLNNLRASVDMGFIATGQRIFFAEELKKQPTDKKVLRELDNLIKKRKKTVELHTM